LLKILQVGYPLAPVGLDATGGAEQVLSILDRALVSRGHQSVVIAGRGSRTAGHLIEIPLPESFTGQSQRAVWEAAAGNIRQALRRWSIDFVHMHGVDFHEYLPPPGVPVLATLHQPPPFYGNGAFSIARPETYWNCVSESQRRSCPPSTIEPMVIGNGVPIDRFPAEPAEKKGYALALGRICPEKGFRLAIEAAERARVPLGIGGKVFPCAEHQRYFLEKLLPRIQPPNRYLGAVGFARRVRLLAHARCLLVTSLVPETSSLVAMEALACGTPVIAFPSGALPEIVEDGRTGFLVPDAAAMADAIGRAREIDPAECQRQARLRFSADRMVNAYFAVYEHRERLLRQVS